jgi:hypothetical protein
MLNEHITIGKQSRHRVYVRDWQKSRTKVKSDARQQKKILEGIIASYISFFFITGRKSLESWVQMPLRNFSSIFSIFRYSSKVAIATTHLKFFCPISF